MITISKTEAELCAEALRAYASEYEGYNDSPEDKAAFAAMKALAERLEASALMIGRESES